MLKKRIVIIGNGVAGFSAASAARALTEDAQIVMIAAEKDPLYSACVLPDYISGKLTRERTFVNTLHDYEKLSIGTFFGREAKEIDLHNRKIRLEDGESVHFNSLILALGSRAIEMGERKKGVFSIKTLTDAEALVRHKGTKAVVVGSGAIGVEVAIALKKRNYEVTLLEWLPRILPLGLDQKVSDRVREVLHQNGINVILNEKATQMVGGKNVQGLRTNRCELECDTVLWAIGMKPNVELARAAGIKVGIKGGMEVDSHMQTNVEGVYACGDCIETNDIVTGRPALNLFWHNANRQGAVAASNSLGVHSEYAGSENLLNLNVFGQHIVGFGQTVSALKEAGVSPTDISVIEKEEETVYHRFVFVENRCVGAQFINPGKEPGFIWGIIRQGRKIDALLELFAKEEASARQRWFGRLRPLLYGKEFRRVE